QALRLALLEAPIVHRPRYSSLDAEDATDSSDKTEVHGAEQPFLAPVERLQDRAVQLEKRGPRVVMNQRGPVPRAPIGVADPRVADVLKVAPFRDDRNSEPLQSARRLDEVSVAPIAPRELHVVVQDELVHRADAVEAYLQGDVA